MHRDVGTVVVTGITAAYVAGFLSWGHYARGVGLGWLPLSLPQWAAIGALTLLLAGLLGLLDFAMSFLTGSLFAGATGLMAAEARVFHAAAAGFAPWAATRFFVLVVGPIMFGTLDAAAILPPLAAVLAWFVLFFARLVFPSPGVRLGERLARERRPHPLDEALEDSRFARRVDWGFSIVVWVLVASAVAGSAVGLTRPEFGGAAPRAAYLDLDPSQVEPSWQAVLFPNGTDLNAPVVRTVPVEVHHRNSDFILFRTAAEPERRHRLFDLSTDVVKAIVWCGDSCDHWPTEPSGPPAANP